jgi:hypothetical protein
MDTQGPDYTALVTKIDALALQTDTKLSAVNVSLTEIKVNLARLDERTQGDNRTSKSVEVANWKWIGLIFTLGTIAVAILALVLKKG